MKVTKMKMAFIFSALFLQVKHCCFQGTTLFYVTYLSKHGKIVNGTNI